MTMTLDEVRKTRFHMSRRNGYEVTDVDIFVDKVEATLVQLSEQNDHLRRQAEAASGSGAPADNEEVDRLRAEVSRLGQASEQVGALQQENDRLGGELDRLRGELDRLGQVSEQVGALQQENEHLRHELEQARVSQGADEGVLRENQRLQQLVDSQGQQATEASRLAQENDRLRAQVNDLANRPAPEPQAAGAPVALPLRVTTAPEASAAVVRLVQLATEQAEALVSEAEAEAASTSAQARSVADRTLQEAQAQAQSLTETANAEAARVAEESQWAAAKLSEESQTEAQRRIDEAAQKSHELTTDARTKADRVESEARVNAERLSQDAQMRADNLDREVADRRVTLFAELETQRDDLLGKVRHLDEFEGSFRTNLTAYLRQQMASLEGNAFSPEGRPALLGEAASHDTSATPRLDALLHDQN